MDPMILTLLVLVLIMAGFFSGKFSFALVSVVGITILEIGGVLSAKEAWAGFSDKSVVLTVALFVLGGGLSKTSLITRLKHMLNDYQGDSKYAIWAILGASSLLAVCTASNIAAATLIPVIISLCEGNPKLSRTQIIKSSGDMMNIWTGTLPLGMSAGTFMLMNSMIENLGGTGNFKIMDITIAKAAPVLVCTIFQFAVGYKFSNKEPHSPLKEFGLKLAELPEGKLTTLTDFQDKAALSLFALSVVGMIFVSVKPAEFIPFLTTNIVAVICAILMVLCGALNEKEAFGSISWNIVFMFAGLLPLSTAMSNSGADQAIAGIIQKMLGGTTNSYVIIAAFFLATVILTQFMSNTAVGMIFLVLAAATSLNMGIDPRAAMLAAAIGSTVSIMSPIASPAQTMVWGTGGYTIRDFLKSGLPLTIIFFIVFIITAPLLFPVHPL